MSIYKSQESEAAMNAWWDRFAARLPVEWESRMVDTTLGPTHVMVMGPPDATPIVVLHGAMAGSAHALSQAGDIMTRYRVYAVDIPGQSPKSVQVRPKPEQYGPWMVEVLDGLGLDTVVLWGVSWGGMVAQRAAAHAPERLRGLMLLNSASLVSGSMLTALWQISLPMLWYTLFPSIERRDAAFAGLFTNTDPDYWSPYIAEAMSHTKMDFSVPPLSKDGEFDDLKAPVLVHAADQDIQFPGEPSLARARQLFPNLAAAHLIPNCKHCPPFDDDGFTGPWLRQVEEFLQTL